MTNYLKWWPLLVACRLVAAVLVPLLLAIVWLTKLVHRAQDRAEIELMCAMAIDRVKENRRGPAK